MNKTLFAVVIILLLIVCGYFIWKNTNDSSDFIIETNDGLTPNKESQNTGPVDMTDEMEVSVRIMDYEYIPSQITVKKGTTVTWINEGAMEHNAMLDHEESAESHNAEEEINPEEFSGPMLATGETYSYTFNEVSKNPYHCAPHPWMKGLVTVVE